MSKDLHELLAEQPDINKIKEISSNELASTFKVTQTFNGKKRKQIVRVIHNISNHYAMKREKDLLQYCNQFPQFAQFNEIRKVGFQYLQFFDYVGKSDLQKTVKKKGTLSQTDARQLLTDMIAILEKVHNVGFVHGNIRPNNIVVGATNFYLIDWTQAIPSLSSYEGEKVRYDALYCAPERLNGEQDEKSDIYLLGCTLYFALTGKHIYRLNEKQSLAEQFWAHAHHSVHKMNKLPIFWRYLVFWMTQKDPDQRPNLDDLKTWIDDGSLPEWVRQMSVRADKSYPQDCLTTLADEHYLYPIYLKAVEHEQNGDLETAFNLYENGAFRGYSLAEDKLGQMYEKGSPVKQSYAMAANMYHQAFQKGNPNATYRLARLFDKGLGMPGNLEYAFKLYRHAASRGHLGAQNALAQMYLNGKGTTKNLAQAHSWLGLAASNGSEEAKQTIQLLIQESKKAS